MEEIWKLAFCLWKLDDRRAIWIIKRGLKTYNIKILYL